LSGLATKPLGRGPRGFVTVRGPSLVRRSREVERSCVHSGERGVAGASSVCAVPVRVELSTSIASRCRFRFQSRRPVHRTTPISDLWLLPMSSIGFSMHRRQVSEFFSSQTFHQCWILVFYWPGLVGSRRFSSISRIVRVDWLGSAYRGV
jgi:hypothetical protein